MQRCRGIERVWVSPGNGGTETHFGCTKLQVKENQLQELIQTCLTYQIDLIVIGAEVPLAEGLADRLRTAGLTVFGPGKQGAQLEAIKTWAKTLMQEGQIPTAKHWAVSTEKEAIAMVGIRCRKRPPLEQPYVFWNFCNGIFIT